MQVDQPTLCCAREETVNMGRYHHRPQEHIDSGENRNIWYLQCGDFFRPSHQSATCHGTERIHMQRKLQQVNHHHEGGELTIVPSRCSNYKDSTFLVFLQVGPSAQTPNTESGAWQMLIWWCKSSSSTDGVNPQIRGECLLSYIIILPARVTRPVFHGEKNPP